MFGLGVGYHRYFAHRAFRTSRPVQFVLALLGCLSVQRGPLWWAWTHREHHRKADTPDDIHSPRYQGFLYAHAGWFINDKYFVTDMDAVKDFAKYPELRFLDRYYALLYGVMMVGFLALFGAQGFVWGFCLSTVLLWHVTHWIQSFSHSIGGYRRYDGDDSSRNHVLIGLISLGEWHNNHHYSPSSARQGHVWWEIDIGYYTLVLMSWLGLVWNLKQPSERSSRGVS
jgi:stearoyl-CoA desaturase (delta-9 desaturase)